MRRAEGEIATRTLPRSADPPLAMGLFLVDARRHGLRARPILRSRSTPARHSENRRSSAIALRRERIVLQLCATAVGHPPAPIALPVPRVESGKNQRRLPKLALCFRLKRKQPRFGVQGCWK